jgi:hypothetical protein
VTPRGLADNNPGNLRATPGIDWLGQTGVDAHGFVLFDTPEHGLRALARTLIEYYFRHGLGTVRGIVARWAPPADGNDTAAYIDDVARRLGVDADAVLDLADPTLLARLVAAIVNHEQGEQPFPADTIAAAVAAAMPAEASAPAA